MLNNGLGVDKPDRESHLPSPVQRGTKDPRCSQKEAREAADMASIESGAFLALRIDRQYHLAGADGLDLC